MTSRRPWTNAARARGPGRPDHTRRTLRARAVAPCPRDRDRRDRGENRGPCRVARGRNRPAGPVAWPPARSPGNAVGRGSCACRRRRLPLAAVLALPAAALAHGATIPVPPDASTLAVRLVVRPARLAAGDVALLLWGVGVERANRAHPTPPDRPPAHGLLGGRRAHDPVSPSTPGSPPTTPRCSRCTWSSTCC